MVNVECPVCKQIFNQVATKNHAIVDENRQVICHNSKPPKQYKLMKSYIVNIPLDQLPHMINDIAGVVNNHQEILQNQGIILNDLAPKFGKMELRVKELESEMIKIKRMLGDQIKP